MYVSVLFYYEWLQLLETAKLKVRMWKIYVLHIRIYDSSGSHATGGVYIYLD